MNTVDRFGGASASLAFKAPCRLATTANITLSGFQTIDGTLPTSSEHVDLRRILVKDQTNQKENGIYIMDTGTWARTKDFDSVNDIRQGTRMFVWGGSTQSGTYVVTSSVDPSTFEVDVGNITIAEVGTFDQTTSALGLTSGGVISWDSGDVTITHSSSALAFAGAGAGYAFVDGVVNVGSSTNVPFSGTTDNAKVQSNATDAGAGYSAGRFSGDSSPARVSLLKSRGSSIGSYTVVQNGDNLGEIRASGADGASFAQSAHILFSVDGTPGSSVMPGRISLRVSSTANATPAELLRVGNSGVTASSNFTVTQTLTASSAVSIAGAASVGGALTASTAITASGLITGAAGVSVNSTFTSSGAILAVTGTTVTAGGVVAKGIFFGGTTNFGIYFGSGAPTIPAAAGSWYIRTDGASSLTRAYIQSSGSSGTWVGLLTTA